ncbi:hypothetical protein HDU76_012177 [Blyttiomyces sp. JEL0837]|nr:hypothetical protein HDU76_012177 [Blyttiomyces sp. JEL0837]
MTGNNRSRNLIKDSDGNIFCIPCDVFCTPKAYYRYHYMRDCLGYWSSVARGEIEENPDMPSSQMRNVRFNPEAVTTSIEFTQNGFANAARSKRPLEMDTRSEPGDVSRRRKQKRIRVSEVADRAITEFGGDNIDGVSDVEVDGSVAGTSVNGGSDFGGDQSDGADGDFGSRSPQPELHARGFDNEGLDRDLLAAVTHRPRIWMPKKRTQLTRDGEAIATRESGDVTQSTREGHAIATRESGDSTREGHAIATRESGDVTQSTREGDAIAARESGDGRQEEQGGVEDTESGDKNSTVATETGLDPTVNVMSGMQTRQKTSGRRSHPGWSIATHEAREPELPAVEAEDFTNAQGDALEIEYARGRQPSKPPVESSGNDNNNNNANANNNSNSNNSNGNPPHGAIPTPSNSGSTTPARQLVPYQANLNHAKPLSIPCRIRFPASDCTCTRSCCQHASQTDMVTVHPSELFHEFGLDDRPRHLGGGILQCVKSVFKLLSRGGGGGGSGGTGGGNNDLDMVSVMHRHMMMQGSGWFMSMPVGNRILKRDSVVYRGLTMPHFVVEVGGGVGSESGDRVLRVFGVVEDQVDGNAGVEDVVEVELMDFAMWCTGISEDVGLSRVLERVKRAILNEFGQDGGGVAGAGASASAN